LHSLQLLFIIVCDAGNQRIRRFPAHGTAQSKGQTMAGAADGAAFRAGVGAYTVSSTLSSFELMSCAYVA
jgi:hypothetical protein